MPLDSAPEAPSKALPDVYRGEGRRRLLSPSLKQESELRVAAEAARARLEAVQSKPEDDDERIKAQMDFYEANLDLEVFDKQHDPTGTLKREIVGRDLAKQITELLPKENMERAYLATPERVTPVYLVNMGELDRVNKEGHGLGNAALNELAQQITDRVGGFAGETPFKVYRADSNSFFVRFEKDISREQAKQIEKALTRDAAESWAGEGEKDVLKEAEIETPPIIVDMMSFEEALAGVPKELQVVGKGETYAVGVMMDTLFTIQEARKIVTRTKRIRKLISQNRGSEAEALYDEYLKKSLKGVFQMETGPGATPTIVNEYVELEAFLRSHEDDKHLHGDDPLWEPAIGKVLGGLRQRYEHDEVYAKKIQAFVADQIQKEKAGLKIRPSEPTPSAKVLETAAPATDFEAPSADQATEGLREFARLRVEIGTLKEKLENAKRPPVASEKEIALHEQRARIAEKKLTLEQARRNTATGLEEQGPMYKRLETALEDGEKRIASVSMDMGFLKYFDQVGGKGTGDLAILKTAEVFQKIKDEFSKDGYEVSAYRLGGDEFGMTVVGDASIPYVAFQQRLRELVSKLKEEVFNAGRIPPQKGAKEGYFGTKLEIGIGVHSYENAAAAEKEAAQFELDTPLPEGIAPDSSEAKAFRRNERAAHLVNVADKVMEFHKSADRFKLLLRYMQEGMDSEHLTKLQEFSGKATFGAVGVEQLKMWKQKIQEGADLETLYAEADEFVWEQLEKEFEVGKAKRHEQGQFVEDAVRIQYLRGRVEELEARLENVEGMSGAAEERHKRDLTLLQQKLDAANEAMEGVRGRREAIARAGTSG